MFEQDAYRIPKIKKEFTVSLHDGKTGKRRFFFFLNQHSKFSLEPQRIDEYLNESYKFIPANEITPDGGESFVIINKDMISYAISSEKESMDSVPGFISSCKFSQILIRNGEILKAAVFQTTPKARSRMIDYISSEDEFAEFITPEGFILYINKKAIVEIIIDNA